VNLELSINIFVEQAFETINCSNIEVQRSKDYFGKMVETKVLRILHPRMKNWPKIMNEEYQKEI